MIIAKLVISKYWKYSTIGTFLALLYAIPSFLPILFQDNVFKKNKEETNFPSITVAVESTSKANPYIKGELVRL